MLPSAAASPCPAAEGVWTRTTGRGDLSPAVSHHLSDRLTAPRGQKPKQIIMTNLWTAAAEPGTLRVSDLVGEGGLSGEGTFSSGMRGRLSTSASVSSTWSSGCSFVPGTGKRKEEIVRERSQVLGLYLEGLWWLCLPTEVPSQAPCSLRPLLITTTPATNARLEIQPQCSLLTSQCGNQRRPGEAGTKCHTDRPICSFLKVGETTSSMPVGRAGTKALNS